MNMMILVSVNFSVGKGGLEKDRVLGLVTNSNLISLSLLLFHGRVGGYGKGKRFSTNSGKVIGRGRAVRRLEKIRAGRSNMLQLYTNKNIH